MWWPSFGKLVASSALWLASTTKTTTTPSSSHTTTATTAWNPQTPQDLYQAFRQLYVDLERPGPRFRDPSPTLRFSYVPPPVNGTSTWRQKVVKLADDDELIAESKPLAVYLPGLDGYGISAARNQFDDMANVFEFWRLTVATEDRSSFGQVVTSIANFIQDISRQGDRPVTLIGESCGGVMAAAVALQLKRREQKTAKSSLKGLVLVNPATSFDRTAWETLVPVLTALKYLDTTDRQDADRLTPYSIFGSLILSSIIPDRDQLFRIVNLIANLPTLDIPPRNTAQLEAVFQATRMGFQETEFRLPPELLEHRVSEWLSVGVPVISKRLPEIHLPTLVIAGKEDALMPSEEEAKRLEQMLPSAKSLIVPNRGHFVLDESVNMTEAILYSDIDPLDWKMYKKRYDPILDWNLPKRDDVEEVVERTVKPFIRAHSPVFFSTDKVTGKRWKGLSKFPEKTGPLLIVGNHQLFGADLRIVFRELMEEKGVVPRGLAHPILFSFSNVTDLQGRTPGLPRQIGNPFNGDYQQFGAVVVSPRNFYRLLQTNQTALLFPGGAKEALKADPDYPLYWPEKVDFVRVAAKLNATVVPLSSIGMVESVNVLLQAENLLGTPFFGDRIRNFTSTFSNARFDKPNEGDELSPSIVAPGIPARNYFLFGRARDLTNVDPNDRKTCERIYREIKDDVRHGLDDLLRARRKDPFANTPQRLAYERVFGKPAPSFAIDELNKHWFR